ncbi:MAG TPA: PilC/PilY family type IV pilus protein [Deltaproteobacteria bacterium]|nr:PilC/PilY family type IV pilus protein [Deltaproteobacteria bacterium]
MSRKSTLLAMIMVLLHWGCFVGLSHADDTEIFGGASINVPPNVLIIFDNSGSMAENVWVQASSADYDPAVEYSGSYSLSRVYSQDCSGWGWWDNFANIGSNHIVDSTEISCTEAREALNTYGHWQGQISGSGTHACGTSYSCRNLRTGNYRNYLASTSGHYEQKISVAKTTIKNLINTTDGVRFGIMVFNDSEGGHVLAPIATRSTATEKATLTTLIDSLSAQTWTPLAETLSEAGLYYARKQSWFNTGVDYATAYDPAIQYRCQKNYIVLMTDGESTQDRNSKLWSTNYLNSKVIGDYDNDASSHDEYHNSEGDAYDSYGSDYLDDVAKFLRDEDLLTGVSDLSGVSFDATDFPSQNIITYTIGFAIDHVLLTEAADSSHGQGDYFTTSGGVSLQDIFESIIGSILETNSQFISPVVPVNRLNRTYADNGLYIGIFAPDSDTDMQGLWKGNLKKFGYSKQGEILDRHGVLATSSTGAILEGAHSVWGTEVTGTEGMTVDVGGAGAVLLTQSSRNFKTNSSTGMVPFNASNVTAANMGLSTDAQRNDLIDFVTAGGIYAPTYTGTDGKNRVWILGDIIHSQPAVYYDKVNNRNIIFVGTNDGFLHCFLDNDNGTSDSLTDDSVQESWAFVPWDLLPNLQYLPPAGYTAEIAGNSTHEYFVDGSPVVYKSGSSTYLAFGLRRGGLNITSGGELTNQYFILNIDNYQSPSFTASISKSILGTSSEQLGQSWSTPYFSTIKTGASTSSKQDVLILTGGYDTNQDNDDPGTADTKGRAVFAVNATTGALMSNLNFNYNNYSKMRYSMVDLRAYDDNDDGCTDVIYAPSVGGDLFVFDDRSTATGTPYDGVWTKRLLFSAANRGSTAKLRKFFYAPGIAQETWGDWVYIASGDREHPTDATGEETTPAYNRFYALRYTWPATWSDEDDALTDSDLTDVSTDTLQGTTSTPSTLTEAEKAALRQALSSSGNGWFFDLDHSGEKAVSTPLVYNKVVYFTTFTPSTAVSTSSTDPCGTTGAGTARLYAVDYETGEAVFSDFDGNSSSLTEEDRSKTIGSGIPSEPTLVVTEQGTFIVVGTEEGPISVDTQEKRSLNRYYWLKQ